MRSGPAFLFDLDGTLVDSVYQHVLAWREALESVGIELSVWRIHRRIGMSGGLFVNALFRETGRELKPEQAAQIRRAHAEAYARQVSQVRPLPGARELLAYLTKSGVPWAIATSGRMESAQPNLDLLGLPAGVPIVTRPGRARQAGPRSVPGGRRAAGGPDRRVGGGGGQRVGPARCPPCPCARRGTPVRWLRRGRARARRRVPGVSGSGGSLEPPRRGRGAPRQHAPVDGLTDPGRKPGVTVNQKCSSSSPAPRPRAGNRTTRSQALVCQLSGRSASRTQGGSGTARWCASASTYGSYMRRSSVSRGSKSGRARSASPPLANRSRSLAS